ncbi:protein kinase domain-containing protein [Actinomadura bangladeshensis]
MLGPDGPRLIDFGIARVLDTGSASQGGGLVGTLRYMPPEVYAGQRAGAEADVFAWGAIMVFAATGTRPSARSILAALTGDPRKEAAGSQDLVAAGAAQAGPYTGWEPCDPALGKVVENAYTVLPLEEQNLVPMWCLGPPGAGAVLRPGVNGRRRVIPGRAWCGAGRPPRAPKRRGPAPGLGLCGLAPIRMGEDAGVLGLACVYRGPQSGLIPAPGVITGGLSEPCLPWSGVVGRVGLEPTTYGLKVGCSRIRTVLSVSDCAASSTSSTIPVPPPSTRCQSVSEPPSRQRANMDGHRTRLTTMGVRVREGSRPENPHQITVAGAWTLRALAGLLNCRGFVVGHGAEL